LLLLTIITKEQEGRKQFFPSFYFFSFLPALSYKFFNSVNSDSDYYLCPMLVYLTGFMGSGKSTYGVELAEELGYAFIDLDAEISEITGMSVIEIFEKKGEDYFREKEAEALLKTFNMKNTIVATGGGAPCHYANMEKMNEHGITIYLKLFENELYNRLLQDLNTRPRLKGKTPDEVMDFVFKTLRERAVFYHQAQIVIYPPMMPANELAKMLNSGQ